MQLLIRRFQRKRHKMAKNRSHIEERNSAIAYQLKQSRRLPFVLSKAMCNELGILLVVGQKLPQSISGRLMPLL